MISTHIESRVAGVQQAGNNVVAPASSAAYTLRLLRSPREVEEVRTAWSGFSCHPFVDIDFYLAILQSRGNGVSPYVIVLRREGAVAGLLVARIENVPRETRLGYQRIAVGGLRRVLVPYRGCLGHWTEEMFDLAAASLFDCLKNREADALELEGTAHDSSLLLALRRQKPLLAIVVSGAVRKHWIMAVPLPGEDPLQKIGSRARNHTRRERRIFLRDFDNAHEFRMYRAEGAVPELIEACEQIAQKTYHRRLGFGFVAGEEIRNRLSLEARRGRLRAYVLYVRNSPAAFWICTLSDQTLFLDYTGFVPEYGKYDVGKLLFVFLLEDVRDHTDARKLDFGSGDGFFKQVFGDSAALEVSVQIFSSAPRNVLWGNAVRVVTALDKTAKSALRTMGQGNRVKKLWRYKSDAISGNALIERCNRKTGAGERPH